MNLRDLESVRKHLERANPPPVLHRYRRPHDWTLEEITKHKIHLTAPDDQNDPFESRTPVVFKKESLRHSFVEIYAPSVGLSRKDAEKEFEYSCTIESVEKLYENYEAIRKDSGIVSLTAVPHSIRMWSYYAQSHEGVCLGFDTNKHPFFAASKVRYQNPEKPIDLISVVANDPTQLLQEISLRKAEEWEFEQEYRISIGQIGTNSRLFPFDPLALTEVRLGARIKKDFREKLINAVMDLPNRPNLIQMKCDFDRFVLSEEPLVI